MRIKLTYYILFITRISFGQDSIKPKWFDLNFNLALIANAGKSNLYESEQAHPMPVSEIKTTSIDTKPICFGYSVGTELILGKLKALKNIVSFNYDYTNSYFNYDFESYTSAGALQINHYHENINKKRNVQFLNFGYGLSFKYRRFFGGVYGIYNCFMSKTEIQNGYIQSNYQIETFKNKKVTSRTDTNFVSLKLKAGIDFQIKNQLLSVFVMRNFNFMRLVSPGHNYLAPWWYLGLQYAPRFNRIKKV